MDYTYSGILRPLGYEQALQIVDNSYLEGGDREFRKYLKYYPMFNIRRSFPLGKIRYRNIPFYLVDTFKRQAVLFLTVKLHLYQDIVRFNQVREWSFEKIIDVLEEKKFKRSGIKEILIFKTVNCMRGRACSYRSRAFCCFSHNEDRFFKNQIKIHFDRKGDESTRIYSV
jgi:hypothetical protein